jgi:hypothetical protein
VPNDWQPAPTNVQQALDQLAARASTDLMFAPSGPAAANVFNDWHLLYNRVLATPGKIRVWILEDFTMPALGGGAAYDFDRGRVELDAFEYASAPIISFAADCYLRGLRHARYVQLHARPGDAPILFDSGGPAQQYQLFLDTVNVIVSAGDGGGVFDAQNSVGSSLYIFLTGPQCRIRSGVGGEVAIKIDGASTLVITGVDSGAHVVEDHVYSSSGGPGNVIWRPAPACLFSTVQNTPVTVQLLSEADMVDYDPAAPLSWPVVPTQVAKALDLLAALFVPSTPVLNNGNVEMTALATVADGTPATATVVSQPSAGAGRISAFVNGIMYSVGDGVKTKPFYISGDGGTTARAFSAVVGGDAIYFNGSVAGFQLAVTDVITLSYMVPP